MEQRISMVTLAVPDVDEARQFFETGLGWKVNAAPSPEIVFFQIIGSVFALYKQEALEKEIGRSVTRETTGAVTLAWNGRTEADVDDMFAKAVNAGAKSVKAPEKAFWAGTHPMLKFRAVISLKSRTTRFGKSVKTALSCYRQPSSD